MSRSLFNKPQVKCKKEQKKNQITKITKWMLNEWQNELNKLLKLKLNENPNLNKSEKD